MINKYQDNFLRCCFHVPTVPKMYFCQKWPWWTFLVKNDQQMTKNVKKMAILGQKLTFLAILKTFVVGAFFEKNLTYFYPTKK